jgi:hypothetical protein
MAMKINASGIFYDGHLSIWHAYLTIALGCQIFDRLGRNQKLTKITSKFMTD